jgi:hypothetical protein
MGAFDWLQSWLGGFAKTQADTVPHLAARTEAALGAELDRLTPEDRGYITRTEATRLFSTSNKPLDEFNPRGLLALGRFAAEHRCSPERAPTGQIYFTKNAD